MHTPVHRHMLRLCDWTLRTIDGGTIDKMGRHPILLMYVCHRGLGGADNKI